MRVTGFVLLVLLALLAPSAQAAQCPPVGTVCSGNFFCQPQVGGYCCCLPYAIVQPNGTIKMGCNNFCSASCSQACSGQCSTGSPCYAGGGAAPDEPEAAGFRLTPDARERASARPYGVLITEALAAFTRQGARGFATPRGVFVSAGTVHANGLPAPWAEQDRPVGFRALWTAAADRVSVRLLFDSLDGDPVPAPILARLNRNGRITVEPLGDEAAGAADATFTTERERALVEAREVCPAVDEK